MARFLVVDLASMGEHHSQIVKAPDEETALRAYLGSLGSGKPIDESLARAYIENGSMVAIEVKPTVKMVADKKKDYYTGPLTWDEDEA